MTHSLRSGPAALLLARLRTATRSDRVALFGLSDEGDLGQAGSAVLDRDDLIDWWLYPDGWLEVTWIDRRDLSKAECVELRAVLATMRDG